MDGQEYLNQISDATRPKQKGGNKNNRMFLSSKYLIWGGIALGALIVILIIGAILGSSKGSEKDYATRLLLHTDNTKEIVKEFQPSVKSSELRGYGASLESLLEVASKDVRGYLEEKYSYKDKSASEKIKKETDKAKEDLHDELFNAKINGVLDRTFAHKMAYEVAMIMTEENKVLNMTKNNTLKEALQKNRDSLKNLYNNFNDFSEAK